MIMQVTVITLRSTFKEGMGPIFLITKKTLFTHPILVRAGESVIQGLTIIKLIKSIRIKMLRISDSTRVIRSLEITNN
jgi:hypothetical protein